MVSSAPLPHQRMAETFFISNADVCCIAVVIYFFLFAFGT